MLNTLMETCQNPGFWVTFVLGCLSLWGTLVFTLQALSMAWCVATYGGALVLKPAWRGLVWALGPTQYSRIGEVLRHALENPQKFNEQNFAFISGEVMVRERGDTRYSEFKPDTENPGHDFFITTEKVNGLLWFWERRALKKLADRVFKRRRKLIKELTRARLARIGRESLGLVDTTTESEAA